jgi:PAS domain S-box-containing protein
MPQSIEIPSEIVHKWQDIVDLLAAIMNIPSAMVMRAEPAAIKVFVSSTPEDNTFGAGCVDPGPFCKTVIKTREPLLVPDALADKAWQSKSLTKLEMISYLGLPISWPDGQIFGTICVRDNKRNEYSELYLQLLFQFRDVLQADLRSLTMLHEELEDREGELRASEARFRTFVDHATDAFFLLDEKLAVVDVNRQACLSLGYSREEMIGMHPRDFDAGLDAASMARLAKRVDAGETVTFESLHRRKDGTVFPVEMRTRQFQQGPHLFRLSLARNITERKRAAEAFSEINERFRVLAESSLSGIYLIQEDLFRYVNPAMARMFGYAVEEVVDRLAPWDLVYPDDRPLVLENIRRPIEGEMEEIRCEFRGLRKDGSAFPVEVHGRRIEHGGKTGVMGTLVDNTDRRRAEDELRASEQRFRDYAEIGSDWFWESGPDHCFSRFSGQPPDRGVSGKFIGSRRWELAADREDEPDKWRAHIATLDAHHAFRDFRYRIARPDGSALYVSVSGKPLFEADGKFLGYRGTATDVTAEVRAEQAEQALREAQADLAHVTRVTTLGELSASIAHEVNQPLAAVATDASAGLRWLGAPRPNLPETKEALGRIIKSANRAAEVIGGIRALTRKAPAQRVELDVNEVILEVIALTRAEMNRNRVELRTHLADDLPAVQTDRIWLQQVILNLISNAIEAMVGSVRRDLLIASIKDDSKVRVEVCDSGRGLEPGTADRIFQAFFTTKPSGMGMGLAICRTIIETLGGKLSARANAPCGTVFEFSIPLEQATESAS